MPYVPSKKTDGASTDREDLNPVVEQMAEEAAKKITNNLSLIRVYRARFLNTADALKSRLQRAGAGSGITDTLANTILMVAERHGYEGAYLGELNYAITRFIQRVPQIKVAKGDWKQEFRYWLYAATVEALTDAAYETHFWGLGISGVFEDIKDEYKRRVNTAYEAEQIVKSGDCYDAPYYTRLVPVVDESGDHVGYQEIMLKRTPETLRTDVLCGAIVMKKPRLPKKLWPEKRKTG